MTKFNLKAVSTYQRQKELMDSIEHLIEYKLEPVDTIEAMNVLMKHKPIWTVEDVSNGKKDYRLVYYVLTPALDLFRITGIPGESKEKDEHLKINEMNLVDLAKATWYVESEVLYKMKTAKSAPGEEDGEVSLKSFAKKESVKKAPTVSKDMEGRDYILVPEAGDDDEKELPVTLRVGDTVYLPNTSDAGGYFIVQRIVNKDTIHVVFMQAGVPVSRNVTRKEVGNKWRFYESASHIGNEIVGVDIIENCFQDKRFYVRKGDVVVAQVSTILENIQGVYEAEDEQLVEVLGFASHEEIIAHVKVYNKVAEEEDTLRVIIRPSKFDQIPEEDEAE